MFQAAFIKGNLMCDIEVFGKRILAKEIPKEKVTGLLILPDENKLEVYLKIVSINENTPASLKVNDTIIVKSSWLHKFKRNDMELVVVPLEDIIGIIK